MTGAPHPTGPVPGILYLLPWSIDAIGGVNQVVINLIRQGRQTGQARPVLLENCPDEPAPRTSTLPDGLTLIRFWIRTPLAEPNRLRTTIGFLARLPRSLGQLRRLLADQGITTVNAHYPSLAALHFRLLSMLGLFRGRLVLSFHGLDVRAAAGTTGLERAAWRWLLRTADSIVACSHALGRELSAFEPRCSGRIAVIHNGVDPGTLLTPAATHVPPGIAGHSYLLSVGTFEHKKGQDVLLEAFALLRPDFPELRLVILGRTTPFLSALRETVSRLDLEDRVRLVADVPHEAISAYYKHAVAFCLPSRAEPFGIVVLEAALFGLPVVATRVGGVGEIVRAGEDGLLVPADDPEALAGALRSTLTDVSAGEQRAASLKRRVQEQFTWHSTFLQYLRLA
jgi:glycosyltransferase involved in cell wall biosynthesis